MVGSVVRRHALSVGPAVGAVIASGSDDTRTVLAIVVLLAVVGVGLAMLAVWVFKVTRPDRELLAPLEVMGDRTWRRGDPVWQRRRLDEVRPADAAPFRPTSAPPLIDESYDAGPTAPGFEDLHDPDDTVATGLPAEGEVPADVASGPDAGMAPDSSVDVGAEIDRSPEPEAGAVIDGAAGAVGRDDAGIDVDDADADGAADGAADADDTVDGGASGETSSLSDDVSSTPRDGVARSPFVSASPSADPDATLADLVAAAEEPASGDDGSDDLTRSGE